MNDESEPLRPPGPEERLIGAGEPFSTPPPEPEPEVIDVAGASSSFPPPAGARKIRPTKPEFDGVGGANLDPPEGWFVFGMVARRTGYLLLAAAVAGLIGFCAGMFLWKTSYTGASQLIHQDFPSAAETFHLANSTPQTAQALITSSEMLARVSAKTQPH